VQAAAGAGRDLFRYRWTEVDRRKIRHRWLDVGLEGLCFCTV
jgi:hypothetical protein